MALCSGIKADGGRCKAQAIRGSEYCVGHDPDQAEARRLRASKGGKRGGRGRPSAQIAEIKGEIQSIILDLLGGSIDRSTGAVVFQGYNTLLKAHSVELAAKEQQEVIERVDVLEA